MLGRTMSTFAVDALDIPPVNLELRPIVNAFTVFVTALGGGKRSPYGWQKQRMRAFVRDNFTCQHPGCTENRLKQISVHHITPRSAGGTDDLDNLVTLCLNHHHQVHGHHTAR